MDEDLSGLNQNLFCPVQARLNAGLELPGSSAATAFDAQALCVERPFQPVWPASGRAGKTEVRAGPAGVTGVAPLLEYGPGVAGGGEDGTIHLKQLPPKQGSTETAAL